MGRAPCCDKDGMKKGPWTPEEDQKLVDYIHKHGCGNWRSLPKNAGLERCGKSCRLRWTNYLRPDIKRGRFSFEEEETIIQLHSILGNKWSAIASRLPGRTDNEIKNYWNTHVKKRLLRMGIDPVTHRRRFDLSSILNPSLYNSNADISRLIGLQQLVNPEILKLISSLFMSSSTPPQQHPTSTFPIDNEHHINTQNPNLQIQTEFNPMMSFSSPCVDYQSFQPQTQGFAQVMSTDHHLPQLADLGLIQQDGFMTSYNGVCDSENSMFQPNNQAFDSMLSTHSSTQTPMNSNTNSADFAGDQDERESYCSDLIKFELPEDILDVNEYFVN